MVTESEPASVVPAGIVFSPGAAGKVGADGSSAGAVTTDGGDVVRLAVSVPLPNSTPGIT